MPLMTGHEAMSHIREHEKNHGFEAVPIVAVSANVVQAAYELGFGYNDFIAKPIVIQEVEEILERYLKLSHSPVCKIQPELKESGEIERLKHALMLDGDQIRQLLDLFHAKMEKMLPQFHKAIGERNFESIAHLAHSIKGSSANFRYEELSNLAALIEESAREERLEFDYSEAFVSFERVYSEIHSLK